MEINSFEYLLAIFLEVWLDRDMNKTVMIAVGLVAVVAIVGAGAFFMMKKGSTPKTAVGSETTPAVMQESPTSVPQTSPATDEGSMQTNTANTKKFTVEGSNFKFVPATLKVKKGDNVEITFKNTGGTHDFMIDEFSVATNKIADGEEETVTFVADKTGKFNYYCSVGNHRAMGMQGVLTVE